MDIEKIEFKRRFAISMYKDMSFSLARMSFSKDFVNDDRGDPYPLLEASEGCEEKLGGSVYSVFGGYAKRFFCSFFPYASYELCAVTKKGAAGFIFALPSAEARIVFSQGRARFVCGGREEELEIGIGDRSCYCVSCRPAAFDLFEKRGTGFEYLHSFKAPEFGCSNEYSEVSEGYVALYAENAEVMRVCSYIDNGISIADVRPIRYENGEVMLEGGRVYLTASIRLVEGSMQGVFSWVPGTAELSLCGAIYYDAGDGRWCGDVAASILYNRKDSRWYLWVCSFSHGHSLARACFEGDPRFGVNVIDVELMPRAERESRIEEHLGFFRDEDPDFYYDEDARAWFMAICRHDPVSGNYKYFFFRSAAPFEGYDYLGCGYDGAETGGSFVRIEGERYFICGNRFDLRSNYRIYSKEGVCEASFNFPDGGFRGWGTLMPIKMGSRTRYFWLTFDRHRGSAYNWSYGNLYLFEGKI